ncbi:MAG: hypothetical protein ACUVQ2_01940 [Dissulfurimicrobium sp.]|uniref:hypothetical protein n=1 Tax=Dissulfurimicrobium sp. TaxID=2022436 RepID=UPI004049BAC0
MMRLIVIFTSIIPLSGLMALTGLYSHSVFAADNKPKHAVTAQYTKNNQQSAFKTKDRNKKEMTEADIELSFEKFAKTWMNKLENINKANSKTVVIKPSTADGIYSGRYICYGPECQTSIKKTDSTETPYIGLIRYSEKHILKKGPTRQDAMNDPGTTIKETPVTEIFRFSKGRWIY